MFSIINPAYNAAHTIVETLDSISSQTYRNYEVVITDDGSTDRTIAICRDYAICHPDMLISLASVPHRGVAGARNDAIARASGKYLCFLDADDRWMPEKLEHVAAITEREPQADLIYHDVLHVDKNGQCVRHISGCPPADPYRGLLVGRNFLRTAAVTVRSSCIHNVGGFNCNSKFECCEDYELWLRLARGQVKFAYIPKVLAQIMNRNGSLTDNVSRHMRNRFNVRHHCLKQALDDAFLLPSEYRRYRDRWAARCHGTIALTEVRRRPAVALQAATAMTAACLRLVMARDWEILREFAHATRLRLSGQVSSTTK